MKIIKPSAIILVAIICFKSFSLQANVIKFLPDIELPAAGYLTIFNESDKDFEIYSVKSNNFKKVELHQSVKKNGRASMQKLEKLKIQANHEVKLEPGGIHLMLFEPKDKLEHDKKIPIYFLDKNNNEVFKALLTLKNRNKEG